MLYQEELAHIPEWGKPFVEDIYSHILQLSGQAYDIGIIKYALLKTFTIATDQITGLSEEKRNEKITKAWLLQLADEAFIRQLLQRLSLDPQLHFDLLYTAFQQKIRQRIASLLQKAEDDPDVDECLQDTFIKIFRSLMSKAGRGQELEYPLTGWLYSVAKGICHDYWEKQKSKTVLTSLEEQTILLEQADEDEYRTPETYVEIKEREERMRACIELLPEPCQTSVRLFYYDALPLTVIAERQNLPISSVKTYIYQLAKRRLRRLWMEGSKE